MQLVVVCSIERESIHRLLRNLSAMYHLRLVGRLFQACRTATKNALSPSFRPFIVMARTVLGGVDTRPKYLQL